MPVCLRAEQLTETSESWHLTTKQIFKLDFSTSVTIITAKIGNEENSNCSRLVISPCRFYIMLFLQPVMYITKWKVAALVNLLRHRRLRICMKTSEIEIDLTSKRVAKSQENQLIVGTFPDTKGHIWTGTPAKRKLECKSLKVLRVSFQNRIPKRVVNRSSQQAARSPQ